MGDLQSGEELVILDIQVVQSCADVHAVMLIKICHPKVSHKLPNVHTKHSSTLSW